MIKDFLNRIIDDSKKWENDAFIGEVGRVNLRKYEAKIEPIEIIYEPKRKGANAIRLKLIWKNDDGELYEAIIEIRISPYRGGGPAFSVYIVDPKTGKTAENTSWQKIDGQYFKAKNMDGMTVQEFCKHCADIISREEYVYKLFMYKQRSKS